MSRIATHAARLGAHVFCRSIEVMIGFSVLGFARTIEQLLS